MFKKSFNKTRNDSSAEMCRNDDRTSMFTLKGATISNDLMNV